MPSRVCPNTLLAQDYFSHSGSDLPLFLVVYESIFPAHHLTFALAPYQFQLCYHKVAFSLIRSLYLVFRILAPTPLSRSLCFSFAAFLQIQLPVAMAIDRGRVVMAKCI